MSSDNHISSTLEDYLEAILSLIQHKGRARVSDIAAELSVHKSTVTAALKNLTEKGLIDYVPYGHATLTSAGRDIALRVAHDHEAIRGFLTDVLQLEEDAAEANACRMEHVMDRGVLNRLGVLARHMRDWRESDEESFRRFVRRVDRAMKKQG